MPHHLVPLDPARIDAAPAKPATFGTVLSGDPRETFLNVYNEPDDRFSCGLWQCTPGIVAMTGWPFDEMCVLLAGRVIITPDGGSPREYRGGDSFAIPKGFVGTWDIRETVRKYYAIQKHHGPLASVRRLLTMPLRAVRPRTGESRAGFR